MLFVEKIKERMDVQGVYCVTSNSPIKLGEIKLRASALISRLRFRPSELSATRITRAAKVTGIRRTAIYRLNCLLKLYFSALILLSSDIALDILVTLEPSTNKELQIAAMVNMRSPICVGDIFESTAEAVMCPRTQYEDVVYCSKKG